MTILQRDVKGLLSRLAIVLTLSLLVSCSSKPENAIVGKWTAIDGTDTMEFFKDGTVTMADGGMTMGGVTNSLRKTESSWKWAV